MNEPKMPKARTTMEEARGQTHGDFSDNARMAIAFRSIMRSTTGWGQLSVKRQLVLDEIALKMARACSGASEEGLMEHFTDIAGYARLGVKP